MTNKLTAPKTTLGGKVLALGSYRPRRIVPNEEIIEAIESSDEWIQQRSGIRARRWAGEDETVQSMAVAASRQAIERAGISATDIDTVIVATVTWTIQTPAVAPLIANELGCTAPAAFDVSAACAGFCTALGLANDLITAGTAKHVLVVGVEKLTDILSLTDRGTAFIFGDGAGAAVVGPNDTDTPAIGPVVWGSDGSQSTLIEQTEDWRDAMTNGSVHPTLRMDGAAVFRWASFDMAKVAQDTLDRSGITADDLDVFVPHQANNRIIDAMARSMKLPDRVRIGRDIADQGNTSAASVPLALDRMIVEGDAKSGDTALLIAFGAGLAYAAQVITVP